jgi:hypothetical protein
MLTLSNFPLIEKLLLPWKKVLGNDFSGYRNHAYRIANFCLALQAHDDPVLREKIAIAAAFHDLGIWTKGRFDYLEPSAALADIHLSNIGKQQWGQEILGMIEQHHKITSYRSNPLVESFRQADWADVSRGKLRFGLDKQFIAAVMKEFPNAGFHQSLVVLVKKRFRSHPLAPLPMMRW